MPCKAKIRRHPDGWQGFLTLSGRKIRRQDMRGEILNRLLEYDRGYATGSVDFLNDETLDVDKAASFLCADCLNEILPQKVSRYFGVGAIHLGTKKIRVFEENFAGFGLGDFYFDCNLMERKNSDSNQMDILIFYCPIRYEETP